MNSQTVKIIRKWARLRQLDYDVCKNMYQGITPREREEMMTEAKRYIAAVADGRIEPSQPSWAKMGKSKL